MASCLFEVKKRTARAKKADLQSIKYRSHNAYLCSPWRFMRNLFEMEVITPSIMKKLSLMGFFFPPFSSLLFLSSPPAFVLYYFYVCPLSFSFSSPFFFLVYFYPPIPYSLLYPPICFSLRISFSQ